MNNETYIEVNRTSQLMNKMRKFSVLIDGVEAGKSKMAGGCELIWSLANMRSK
ncbi:MULTISPECIES: hypothetical protein [Bacillus]|uniref:hypothetical protein n=1 Tax=Bacillus TaxID=1386 RepID=UPI001E36A721|nr:MULTISPECIES: hypothetical protein [Bacillus]MDR9801677.1 hypothetical protein [Bacillus paralicheniformis]